LGLSRRRFSLLIVSPNAGTAARALEEIEWRAGYRGEFSCRNQTCVDRRIAIGVQIEFLAEDVTATLYRVVEVSVVSKVYDCRLVCSRGVDNLQSIAFQGVTHMDRERARKSLIAVKQDASSFRIFMKGEAVGTR
jgi:hypothetical protein